MRICIPTEHGDGPGAPIAEHFGRAAHLVVLDTTNDSLEVADNPGRHDRPGGCGTVGRVRRLAVDAVVCREMGRKAAELFAAAGIALYEAPGDTVASVAAAARDGSLVSLRPGAGCHGHGGHHGAGSMHRHQGEHAAGGVRQRHRTRGHGGCRAD